MQNGPDNKKVKRTGTGENKTWDSGAGKAQPKQPTTKTYRKDPSGKVIEYTGIVYNEDDSKPMKANPHQRATDDVKKSNPSYKTSTIVKPL